MKKGILNSVVALAAVFAFGVVGCSNGSSPTASDSAVTMAKMIPNNASSADAMGPKNDKRTGPPIYGLANKAGLSTLATAIEAAGLNKVLNTGGPFTVFAPTNEAFAALPEGTLESLLQDKEALTNILLYHVVAGEVMASDVVGLTEATMLNGDNVSITVGDGVMVNDANVIATDILAKNGVVHVIDKVLIP